MSKMSCDSGPRGCQWMPKSDGSTIHVCDVIVQPQFFLYCQILGSKCFINLGKIRNITTLSDRQILSYSVTLCNQYFNSEIYIHVN